jgi:hypothetical protein
MLHGTYFIMPEYRAKAPTCRGAAGSSEPGATTRKTWLGNLLKRMGIAGSEFVLDVEEFLSLAEQPSSVDDLQISGISDSGIIRFVRFGMLLVLGLGQHFFRSLNEAADCGRGPEDVSRSNWTYKLLMSHSRKSHRGNTAAPRAIGVTAKLAGFDPRCEVCRERPRGLGEDAPIGRCGR